ncbi:MAG TPA: APC family permease [Bryobacteraceae bacterium]|nr:APC family permease [Bryobacteraceae bacterium]
MTVVSPPTTLRRVLRLRHLVFYGIVLIQPTAPMPLFGVASQVSKGHAVLAVLIALVAMLFTAIAYGRMARVYPSAGSAYTYVGREIHSLAGEATGWAMMLDYILNPILCTIWCSKAAGNFLPAIPYGVWVVFFALLFTSLNLRGVEASARTNTFLACGLGGVIVIFFGAAARYLWAAPPEAGAWLLPFYNPATFSSSDVLTGASIAALTYIGFDGISTLSEEVENPKRNILRATVLTCAITGVLATAEVYIAQVIWPDYTTFPDADTAYVYVGGRVGGPGLFALLNFSLLVASVGSGMGAQLGAARLMFAMGRENTLPRKFFATLSRAAVPANAVLLVGALCVIGGFALSYQLAAELLNFGAFIAFMGVNVAALRHALRSGNRSMAFVLPPVAGFLVCFYIWLNLRPVAQVLGAGWLTLGLLYAMWRRRNGSYAEA